MLRKPRRAASLCKKTNISTVYRKLFKKKTFSLISYELEDGQFREEEIFVLNKGTKDEEIAVIGSYAFWGTDNFLYVTRYTADRNGYRAKTTQSHRDGFSTKTTIDEIAGDEPNKESEGVNNL